MQDRYKYRVWDKNLKVMYPVWCLTPYGAVVDDLNIAKREISFNDCEVMQCTGLKDKDGKLIYEGDILKIYTTWKARPYYYAIVKWKHNRYKFQKIGKGVFLGDIAPLKVFLNSEVVGNIYENPELLEVKND